MLGRFTPNEYIKSYKDLNVQRLKGKGIQLIICDIDNTLVAHDKAHADDDVKAFVQHVQEVGLQICLISNNNKERVSIFAKSLGIHSYGFSKKPLKITYRKILKDYKIKRHHIAAIGDQLLTDVFGGNRMKIHTILTSPVVERDLNFTKINRKIENVIFNKLEKKNILKRGVFDE